MLPIPALDPKYKEDAERYVRLYYGKGAYRTDKGYSETHKNLLYMMVLYISLPVLSLHTFQSVRVPETTPEAELREVLMDAVYDCSAGCICRDDLLAAAPAIINLILQQRSTLRGRQ